jgi:hypothetical protein
MQVVLKSVVDVVVNLRHYLALELAVYGPFSSDCFEIA